MDGSDGCIKLWMYLIPLNYTLKNIWEGKIYVHFTTVKTSGEKTLYYNVIFYLLD